MNRRVIIAVVLLVIFSVAGYFGYVFLTADPELSGDISDVSDTIDEAESGVVFRIDASQSEASFALEEDLRGVRTDVVGTTDQVGADILIDFDTPSNSNISTITINARDLATGNALRDGQIRRSILRSSNDEYEFITFAPTELVDLPETIEVGQTYSFQIVGDLTIIETTNAVTFDAEVTVDSEDQISGTATSNVLYADYGISIPSVPGVANITDDVDLTIDFVAVAVGSEADTDTEVPDEEVTNEEESTDADAEQDAPAPDATEEVE